METMFGDATYTVSFEDGQETGVPGTLSTPSRARSNSPFPDPHGYSPVPLRRPPGVRVRHRGRKAGRGRPPDVPPEDTELDRVENVGHHGDRIVVLSARIENADGMRHVLDRLSELDEVDRVIDELDQRVDDNCALFLRVDKQAAFGGEVRLGPGITVRAKVEAYPAKKEAAVENARETLGRLADDSDDNGDDSDTSDDDTSDDDASGDDDTSDES